MWKIFFLRNQPQSDNQICFGVKTSRIGSEWQIWDKQRPNRMIERGRERGKASKSLEKVMQLWTIEGWMIAERWGRSRKVEGGEIHSWEREGGGSNVINGRVVVERLRQTGREQSDSNKVNLPPIHLPQHVSRLTGRALHTLTNATLCMRAQTGVPHTAFGCYTPPHKWTRTFSWPPVVGFMPVRSSIIHQQR